MQYMYLFVAKKRLISFRHSDLDIIIVWLYFIERCIVLTLLPSVLLEHRCYLLRFGGGLHEDVCLDTNMSRHLTRFTKGSGIACVASVAV